MNKKKYRKLSAFIFAIAIFLNLGLDSAQAMPDTTTIFIADFNTDADSFSYSDDLFHGSSQPDYASGARVGSGGFDGGALRVDLGGIDAVAIDSISGGWERTFTLDSTKIVLINFRYNLTQTLDYDSLEVSQALFSFNGTLMGEGSNDFLVQIEGEDNDTGSSPTTGWLSYAVELGTLSPGSYTVALGGFNNKKTRANESTLILFDDVRLRGISVVGNAPEAPTVLSPATNVVFNAVTLPINMVWSIPADADDDSLHFAVEIAPSVNFISPIIYNSQTQSGFLPLPPVPQGVGNMTFQVPATLADGVYFWRVRGLDSANFGSYSEVRRFRIDTVAPEIDSLTIGNPEPIFPPAWYNQTNVDSVDLAVYYNEINLTTLVYTLGALGGNQSPSVPSGINQADTMRLNISGQSDGTYPITVTITDSANNQASQNTNIFLDSTAPTGTRASLDSVVSEDVHLSWGNSSDGTGSGLSGKYRVQRQINGGAWETLYSETSITSVVFNGQQGNTYGFEAVSSDNVGNSEAFSNIADFTVEIDTTSDVNAPGAPIQLSAGGRVSASVWQASTQFAISWQNPPDPSGLATAFYKLGSAPVSNSDFADSTPAGAQSLNITVTQENGVNLYLWLSDNAGNTDFQNFSSVLLRYDTTAPTGATASSPDTSADETFTVNWGGTGSDGDGAGLSGGYDLRVQVDGNAFANWLTNFPGTSNSFEGEQGHVYGFEVVAYDSVGNVEAFTGNAESTTFVDTLSFDNVAPGPPLGMAANGGSPKSPWQNLAQFAVAWNPPTDISGISLALYKMGDAPIANFDTTGSVKTGNSVIVTAEEGRQNFYLWFMDGQQQVDFNNYGVVQLRYDATDPVFNQTSVTNSDFTENSINWFNPTITPLAQVQVDYSEDHANTLQFESTGLGVSSILDDIGAGNNITETAGINLSTAADGSYDMEITLSDSASNSTKDTLKIALDNTAPTETTASSPDTSSNTTFRVSWAGTGSDGSGSGLSGRFNVRVQENGGSWVDWQTNFTGTSQDFTGQNGVEYGFEVAAIDNVGNVESFQSIAETATIVDTVFVDGTAPTIAHTLIVFVEQGADITIEAQVADNNQVGAVTLFYRQNGVSSFQSVEMMAVSGNNFAATISATQVSTLGLSYYIQASDGLNTTFSPATNWDTEPYNISIRITGTDAQGIVKSTTQPSGSDASSYRMVSVPLNPDAGDAISVLQDDLGTYDPAIWRLFQYIAASDSYVEYPDVIDFSPGKALWLIVKNSDVQLDSGVGASVPANEPFEITLSRGWNDIGNPFQFAVDVNNIVITLGNSGGVQGPYTYQGQWLLPTQVTQLNPWEGYSFFSDADNVTIAINPVAASTSPSAQKLNRILDFDWAIDIKAYSGELKDEFSRIGVSASANENWDALDFLEPPFISERVSVTFPHHDWLKFPGNFKSDFQPSAKDGWVWHFEAETSQKSEKIRLVFDNLESLPGNLTAVLIDRMALQKIDLDALSEYEFLPDQKTLSRQFELVVGTNDFLSNSENILSLVPDQFFLSQNYPNPFNAGTKMVYHTSEQAKIKIDIMNILGQEVITLINEYKEPGVYTLNWDGKGGRGVEVPSGMYFVKMQAGKFQKIRKMLYIR